MIKAKPWDGKPLQGEWEVSFKLDGVRALWNDEKQEWESRAGKPLYNLPPIGMSKDVEVFCGSWEKTISCVRAPLSGKMVPAECLYSLSPLDERLRGNRWVNPTDVEIIDFLKTANRAGFEGLVLRQGDKWLKVKPEETHDVKITGAIEGNGKHKGKLGALLTEKGKVGTGFPDAIRTELWELFCTDPDSLIGSVVEVACDSISRYGKFRHSRFVRMRPDKSPT